MRPHRLAYIFLLVSCLCPFASSFGGPDTKSPLLLLTPKEAKQLRLTEQEWRQPQPRARALSLGPRIVIHTPTVKDTEAGREITAVTPTDLQVSFEESQAPVDMTSLEVRARKGLFSKSLTSLLRPYIQGSTLHVADAEVPTGHFLLEISIADQNGATTVETYRLAVSGR